MASNGGAIDGQATFSGGRTQSTLRDPVVWLAVAVGAGARFYRLGERPLWADEAMQALGARSALTGVDRWMGAMGDFIGYTVQQWLLADAPTEFNVRLVSALLGSLLPLALAWAVAAGPSAMAPRVAAWLSAVSFPLVYYAQEGRGYAAAVTFCILAAGAAARLKDPDEGSRIGLWGWLWAGSVGAILSAQFAFVFVGLLWLFLLPTGFRSRRYWIVLVSVAAVGLFPAAVYLHLAADLKQFQAAAKLQFRDFGPSSENVLRVVTGGHPAYVALWGAAALVGVGAVARGQRNVWVWHAAVAVTMAVLVGGLWMRDFPMHMRYLLLAVPWLIAFVAEGIARLASIQNHPWVRALAAIALTAAVGAGPAVLTAAYSRTIHKLTFGVDAPRMAQIIGSYPPPRILVSPSLSSFAGMLLWYAGDRLSIEDRLVLRGEQAVFDAPFWQRLAAGRWKHAAGRVTVTSGTELDSVVSAAPAGVSVIVATTGDFSHSPCARYDDICVEGVAGPGRVDDVRRAQRAGPWHTDIWTLAGLRVYAATTNETFQFGEWWNGLQNSR